MKAAYRDLIAEAKQQEKAYTYRKGEVLAIKTQYLKEAIEAGKKCERCERTQNLTLDHIVPMDFLVNIGYDRMTMWDEENMAILCKICNTFKGNRFDFSDKRTKPLLLKYIQNIE